MSFVVKSCSLRTLSSSSRFLSSTASTSSNNNSNPHDRSESSHALQSRKRKPGVAKIAEDSGTLLMGLIEETMQLTQKHRAAIQQKATRSNDNNHSQSRPAGFSQRHEGMNSLSSRNSNSANKSRSSESQTSLSDSPREGNASAASEVADTLTAQSSRSRQPRAPRNDDSRSPRNDTVNRSGGDAKLSKLGAELARRRAAAAGTTADPDAVDIAAAGQSNPAPRSSYRSRNNSDQTESSTETGNRAARSEGGAKNRSPRPARPNQTKPFSGRNTSTRSSPKFTPATPLTPPPKHVTYNSVNLASLIAQDLNSHSTSLKIKEENAETSQERMRARAERFGDYSQWVQDAKSNDKKKVGKAGETVQQARNALMGNPSVGLAEREFLLKKVEQALG